MQLHVIASTKTFGEGVVLNLQLGYLQTKNTLNISDIYSAVKTIRGVIPHHESLSVSKRLCGTTENQHTTIVPKSVCSDLKATFPLDSQQSLLRSRFMRWQYLRSFVLKFLWMQLTPYKSLEREWNNRSHSQ